MRRASDRAILPRPRTVTYGDGRCPAPPVTLAGLPDSTLTYPAAVVPMSLGSVTARRSLVPGSAPAVLAPGFGGRLPGRLRGLEVRVRCARGWRRCPTRSAAPRSAPTATGKSPNSSTPGSGRPRCAIPTRHSHGPWAAAADGDLLPEWLAIARTASCCRLWQAPQMACQLPQPGRADPAPPPVAGLIRCRQAARTESIVAPKLPATM